MHQFFYSGYCGLWYYLYKTIVPTTTMDDLKLFASSVSELQSLTNTVLGIAGDFGMSLNQAKSAWLSVSRGRPNTDMPELVTITGSRLGHINEDKEYRYLGIQERAQFCCQETKELVRTEFIRRLKLMCRSGLHSRNLFQAINGFAIPVVLYSILLLGWTKAERSALDRLVRHHLVQAKAHHPRASIHRLFIPRDAGGRGLLSIEDLYQRTVIRVARYLVLNKPISLVSSLYDHHLRLPPAKSLLHRAQLFIDNLELPDLVTSTKQHVKRVISEQHITTLESMPLHGRYWIRMRDAGLDRSLSLAWLKSPTLRPETEGFVIAAQDQVVATRNYMAHVSRVISADQDRCRACNAQGETLDHVLGFCPPLARTAYITRHNRVVQSVHWAICKRYEASDLAPSPRTHKLIPVVHFPGGGRLLWEQPIPTDLPVGANRPDMLLQDSESGHVFLIDISVPLDINVVAKALEKKTKYASLQKEVLRMWSPKNCSIVPIVIGVLGGVEQQTKSNLHMLCGPAIALHNLQQQAIIGSLGIIRSVLNSCD